MPKKDKKCFNVNSRVNIERIPLECYSNGSLEILPAKDVRELTMKANFAWCLPSDRYMWVVEEIKGWNQVYRIAGKPATEYAIGLHTNDGQPILFDVAERLFNKGQEMDPYIHATRICRFHGIVRIKQKGDELPSKFWPIQFVKIPDRLGNMRPAYQMNPKFTSIVVAGIDQDSEYRDFLFPWSYLWKGLC
jgi:hypothetical protein